jgi:hypothetical protein
MTLPVVDEVGELSSIGGRSATDENETEREMRPPTPPKESSTVLEQRPKKHGQSGSLDSNKALPPLPMVMSSEPISEKVSVIV